MIRVINMMMKIKMCIIVYFRINFFHNNIGVSNPKNNGSEGTAFEPKVLHGSIVLVKTNQIFLQTFSNIAFIPPVLISSAVVFLRFE